MKTGAPLFPIPELLESPVPLLTLRRSIIKVLLNDCFLFIFTAKTVYDSASGEKLKHLGFPWLLLSLMFTAVLFVITNPKFKQLKYMLAGNFLAVILSMRFVILVHRLNSAQGLGNFTDLEFIVIDVSKVKCPHTYIHTQRHTYTTVCCFSHSLIHLQLTDLCMFFVACGNIFLGFFWLYSPTRHRFFCDRGSRHDYTIGLPPQDVCSPLLASATEPRMCCSCWVSSVAVLLPPCHFFLLPHVDCGCDQTSGLHCLLHSAEKPISAPGVYLDAPSNQRRHGNCLSPRRVSECSK